MHSGVAPQRSAPPMRPPNLSPCAEPRLPLDLTPASPPLPVVDANRDEGASAAGSFLNPWAKAAPNHVIPPGREPFVAALLGDGQLLGDGCQLLSAHVEESQISADYKCADGRPEHVVLVYPIDDAPLRTSQFALASPPSHPAFTAAFLARIRAREGAWTWQIAVPGSQPPQVNLAVEPTLAAAGIRAFAKEQEQHALDAQHAADPWVTANFAATCLFAILAVLTAPLVCRAFLRSWRTADNVSRRLAVFAIALGSVLRLIVVPKQLAMLFVGYYMTSAAIDLSPHAPYGFGAELLYHALFQFLPHDHRTILWANALLGSITLPILFAFASRILQSPRAGALATLLIATVPVFLRQDTSEANQVPVMLWSLSGLLLLIQDSENPRLLSLLGAAILLGLAMLSRPEFVLLAPALALLVASRPQLRRLRTWLVGCAVLAFVAPQIRQIARSLPRMPLLVDQPGSFWQPIYMALNHFDGRNVVLRPTLFPMTLTLLALLALHRTHLRVTAMALLCFFAVIFDLDLGNLARVQAPFALFVTLLAASSLQRLLETLPQWPARIGVALVVMLSFVPSALRFWQPTNEAEEEAFIRRALAQMPEGQFTLVRIQGDDALLEGQSSPDLTPFAFPEYLFTPPQRAGRVVTIGEFLAMARPAGPVFFYQGVRCFARFRSEKAGVPHGTNFRKACALLQEKAHLTPVLTYALPNHGDVWQPDYGDAPVLPLALFRVEP
jgi:hypothetical protein